MLSHPSSIPHLLRAAALRSIERRAAALPLMERAGTAAAAWAAELCPEREAPVLIVAGPGNNGGDAFVVARQLRAVFRNLDLVFTGTPGRLPADAAAAHAAWLATGGTTLGAIPDRPRWGLIVDGLFGIGLQRDVGGEDGELVEAMNWLAAHSRCPLLALDCPSGLDADTGARRGATIRASHTISFIAAKPGLLTGDGPDHCGELCVAALGLDLESLLPDTAAPEARDYGRRIDRELFAAQLLRRPRNSHKGSFGSAGIIGGAPGMSGAAILAGRAAQRLGAGRVFVGLPEGIPGDYDPLAPELMLRDGAQIFAAPLTALAVGPGLGDGDEARQLLETAIVSELPLVLDADALNLLAGDPELRIAVASRPAPTVLTPHPTEAARLLERDTAAVQADRIAAAGELAAQLRARVVLKGCGSIVAAADGHWWINGNGGPALAGAGSGDVLTGMIVALLAQGWPDAAATLAAVHLHAAAADSLVDAVGGEIGIGASELPDAARRVLNRWIGERAAATPHAAAATPA